MLPEEARQKIETELARAKKARGKGNEGMARVCARRAAGYAVAADPRRVSRPGAPAGALNHLRALEADASAPPDVRTAAARLTARITPEHTLPFDEDPLDDARRIIEFALSNE